MCGICGYISKHEYPIKILKKMNDTMVHRGPNDSGEIIERMSDGAYIGLGQRRLSIPPLKKVPTGTSAFILNFTESYISSFTPFLTSK